MTIAEAKEKLALEPDDTKELGMVSGKRYFEVEVASEDGIQLIWDVVKIGVFEEKEIP